mmetsp:Transcript_1604/g.1797  ORF Transcript_1604/g.1797 Transcript_1604/m.1797 type:complete len:343 (-) Transcript_1604:57-1085(-)
MRSRIIVLCFCIALVCAQSGGVSVESTTSAPTEDITSYSYSNANEPVVQCDNFGLVDTADELAVSQWLSCVEESQEGQPNSKKSKGPLCKPAQKGSQSGQLKLHEGHTYFKFEFDAKECDVPIIRFQKNDVDVLLNINAANESVRLKDDVFFDMTQLHAGLNTLLFIFANPERENELFIDWTSCDCNKNNTSQCRKPHFLGNVADIGCTEEEAKEKTKADFKQKCHVKCSAKGLSLVDWVIDEEHMSKLSRDTICDGTYFAFRMSGLCVCHCHDEPPTEVNSPIMVAPRSQEMMWAGIVTTCILVGSIVFVAYKVWCYYRRAAANPATRDQAFEQLERELDC